MKYNITLKTGVTFLMALVPILFFCPINAFCQFQADPPRLPRKDSFFGLHTDFHAMESDRNIGQNTTPEMIEHIIDLIDPDYIEVDTKGHPGYSSYPTRVGFHGNHFVGDPLKVWREVTAKRGVALYAHFSGVMDDLAMKKHPDWAIVDANGNRSPHIVSIFGPYVDRLMIPQMIELGKDYGLDGVWIDGNTWGCKVDYSDAAKKEFTRQTGIKEIPTKQDDPHWNEWIRFQRESFRKFMRYYIEKVKSQVPGFQIADNWAFTEQMPEPVCADVDYISGDICGYNCVNVCRFASRFMASQDITWDLMSWSFAQWRIGNLDPPETRKTAVQLMREAACVIAQGGGYQAVFSQAGPGFPPRRDGSVDLEKLKPMGEVAKFCRERQEVCFKAEAIPQIAVLYSTEAAYRKWDGIGNMFFWDAWQRGIVNCLMENQCCVEVLLGTTLAPKIDDYPLVVICEWNYLEPEIRDKVADYVRKGGNLLLVGESAIGLFEKEIGSATEKRTVEVPQPYALTLYEIGKGKIGCIPQTLTNEYAGNPKQEIRDTVGTAVRNLFPAPVVTVTGSHDIDVSLMRTVAGKTAVHLVNTSGPHRSAAVIESIEPVGPLRITLRLPEKPNSIVLEPGKRTCSYVYENGKIELTVPSVPIHEIVVLE